MSQSKYRYYEVTTVSVVRANNQTDAIAVTYGEKVDAEILADRTAGYRLTAPVARRMVEGQYIQLNDPTEWNTV